MGLFSKKVKRSFSLPEPLYNHLESLAKQSGRFTNQVVEFQLYTALILTAKDEAELKAVMALIPPEYGGSVDAVLKTLKIDNPLGDIREQQFITPIISGGHGDTVHGFFSSTSLHTLW